MMQNKYKSELWYILLIIGILLYTKPIVGKNIDGKGDNFANQELLDTFFKKLYNLERDKKGKINIVHIGDSHIQADIFTNSIRQQLQQRFGNGGLGFTFPYRLMKTNGSSAVQYASNATWQSQMNIYPVADVGVGLSGIALFTSSEDFMIQLTVDDQYKFNNIKVVYPTTQPQYKVSVSADTEIVSSASTVTSGSASIGYKSHKIKSGESLSTIARKYRTTITKIKTANGLRSNVIHAGRTLKIPVAGAKQKPVSQSRVSTIKLKNDSLDFVELNNKPYYSSYTCDSIINRIAILPNGKNPTYNLNGFVLQNDQPGVIYHAIGVNGAKLSDYTKYPLFFKQLPILEPDLIILSFGTNESFGRLSSTAYIMQLKEFVAAIRAQCGNNVAILVMTPPPSLFRRGRVNPYVVDYSGDLMDMTNLPVWDLYNRMGGLDAIRGKGEYSTLIARDKVHYTVKGYQSQGEMFANDFINAYTNFKQKQKIGDSFKTNVGNK